jgi:hypothetical protein
LRNLAKDNQTVYIANETGFETYGEPSAYQGIISAQNNFVRDENAIVLDEFDEVVTFEKAHVTAAGIGKTSHFWLRRVPDPDQQGGDFTHELAGIQISPDNQYAMVVLSGADGYNPLE